MTPKVWTALHVFALSGQSGQSIGGLWLRARPGPAREAALDAIGRGIPKVHPQIDDQALMGGMGLAESLAAGRPVHRPGLLSAHDRVCLTMAERSGGGLAARLGAQIDAGRLSVLAIDEGEGPDERPPAGLTDRLGLFVTLDGCRPSPPPSVDFAGAARRLPHVVLRDADRDVLVRAAHAAGIVGLRPPIQAIAAARAIAALAGRDKVIEADLSTAAELVYAHRTRPDEAPDTGEAPADREETPQADRDPGDAPRGQGAPEDRIVASARAALPPELVAALAGPATGGGGAGAASSGTRRGRPLPARPGQLGAGRIDLTATLRAAAPWQTIRRRSARMPRPIHLRPSDIRLARREEHADRLLIFVVDASGSSAAHRLGEAKGAVERILADAYAKRDHVALVAFRGTSGDCLLPPTRSLARARRLLAGLPGGGGTPLAAGLDAAGALVRPALSRGFAPALVLMTDGRANIDAGGRADPAGAKLDADRAAARLRAMGLAALVVDTGRRQSRDLADLAATLGARYAPMPRADAGAIASLAAAGPRGMGGAGP